MTQQQWLLQSAAQADRACKAIRERQAGGILYEVILRPWKGGRSRQGLLKRYWAMLTAASSSCGHTAMELHIILKTEILGDAAMRTPTVHREYMDYVQRAEAWLASHHLPTE